MSVDFNADFWRSETRLWSASKSHGEVKNLQIWGHCVAKSSMFRAELFQERLQPFAPLRCMGWSSGRTRHPLPHIVAEAVRQYRSRSISASLHNMTEQDNKPFVALSRACRSAVGGGAARLSRNVEKDVKCRKLSVDGHFRCIHHTIAHFRGSSYFIYIFLYYLPILTLIILLNKNSKKEA